MEETSAFHLDDVSICKDVDDSPGGPDATYDGILLTIDKSLQPRVVDALKWLAFSFDTLAIDLLAEIFTLQIPSGDTGRLFSADNVLGCLSGLVVADEHHVRLAHSSIKEYLTSSRISRGPASAFSFTDVDAHLYIARSCLVHHLQCNAPGLPNEEPNTSKLKTYAARNWPLHLEMVPRSSWPLETAQAANLALAIRSRSLLSMIDSLDIRSLFPEAWLNPLNYTAYSGASQLTETLISGEFNMHEYITQGDLDAALLNASSEGKLEVIRLLVNKGAGVDAENAVYRNPLTEAAEAGHFAAVRFLLENEAATGALHDSIVFKSALKVAAGESHLEIVELLVRNGAEVDKFTLKAVAGSSRDEATSLECLRFLLDNSNGISMAEALCKAALKRNWKAFELLLSRGADINALGSRWGNPLHIACAAEDIDKTRIEYLLRSGADPNIQGGAHGTALQAVCYSYAGRDEEACIEIAKLLMARGVDISAQGGEHDSALKNACASKGKDGICWYNMAELLLEKGADVNAQGGPYANALQVACHVRNPDIVPLLLAWGADINAQGAAFTTALHAACLTRPKEGKQDDVKMVRLLLDHGADVNATGKNKAFGTALQAACTAGNMELVRLLVDHGAKVDLQSGGYGTALQAACQWGHTDVVRFLLDNGADVNALGRKIGGRFGTALQTACSFTRSNDEIVCLLLNHGADIHAPGSSSGPIFQAAASSDGIKNNAVLLRLLELGADVNEVDERRGTALHCVLRMASKNRDTKPSRIRFLIEHGADVNLAAGKLGSPLHWICAAPMNFSDVYETDRTTALLLEICPQIEVSAQGGEYGSALQAAAWSGQAESIKLLIRKGAQVNSRGGKYESALNAAIVMGYWHIVKILLENGAKPDFHWRHEPDEDWLAEIRNEHGRRAVERYRRFWEVEKRKVSAESIAVLI